MAWGWVNHGWTVPLTLILKNNPWQKCKNSLIPQENYGLDNSDLAKY